MQPATRTQSDRSQGDISRATRLICRKSTNRARQEDAADADINTILRKHTHGLPLRPLEYGQVDFDLDLTGAYAAVAEARRGFRLLPPHLRAKYPSWESLMAAVANGEVVSLDPANPPAEASAASPPNPPKEAASEAR